MSCCFYLSSKIFRRNSSALEHEVWSHWHQPNNYWVCSLPERTMCIDSICDQHLTVECMLDGIRNVCFSSSSSSSRLVVVFVSSVRCTADTQIGNTHIQTYKNAHSQLTQRIYSLSLEERRIRRVAVKTPYFLGRKSHFNDASMIATNTAVRTMARRFAFQAWRNRASFSVHAQWNVWSIQSPKM